MNAPTYDCATWGSVSVSPSETTLGHSVWPASATATAVNPAALTYAWSAPSGTFSAPTAASTSYTCATQGVVTLTLTVGDGAIPAGGACDPARSTTTVQVTCDLPLDAGVDATVGPDASADGGSDAGAPTAQALVTTLGAGVLPTVVTINQGTAIGEGALNGSTPFLINNLAADPNNTTTLDGGPPFLATGNVPDTAFGFCNYPTDGGAPTRITHVTGAKFETAQTDPMEPLTPAYFPLVYTSTANTSDNAFGGKAPHDRPLRLAAQGHRRGAARGRIRRQRQDLVFRPARLRAESRLHEPHQRGVLAGRDVDRLPGDGREHERELRLGQRFAGR